MNVFQFALEYLQLRLSSLVAGQRNYPEWKIKNYSMRCVALKNQHLAKELETACRKNGGILTYAEYLAIEQFGKNGYHATHTDFGRTGTHQHWAKALIKLCIKNGYNHVVEFGSGDGALGIELAKQAQKENIPLLWHGVEINKKLFQKTKEGFREHRVEKFLGKIVSTFNDLHIKEPCLVVFSYSLDSIPPEIFINSKKERGVPDTIIGINIKDNILTEHILTKEQLKQKGIAIENGIVRYKSNMQSDLRSWKLYPWQRAYISLEAFTFFHEAVKHCPKNSMFVIIDEFRPAPFAWETNHLCVPKSLYTFQREPKNITAYYEQAGKNLLYYPIYLDTFTKLLNSVGFSSIEYDIEQKMAKDISKEVWIPLNKEYFTYAFVVTKQHSKIPDTVVVAYPGRTLV